MNSSGAVLIIMRLEMTCLISRRLSITEMVRSKSAKFWWISYLRLQRLATSMFKMVIQRISILDSGTKMFSYLRR
jgi:hypothetical protein